MITGLRCPDCDSTRLRVVQTCPGEGQVVRRRKCANGHNFITVEEVATKEVYNAWHRDHYRDRVAAVRAEA